MNQKKLMKSKVMENQYVKSIKNFVHGVKSVFSHRTIKNFDET